MAYPQDYRNDPITGSPSPAGASSSMRDDPRADFRSDMYGDDASSGERDDAAAAAIERDIDQTRMRMDQTVDNLTQRLRPSNIISDLLDYFASDEGLRTDSPKRRKIQRVAKRAGRGAWDTIRENPIPSALIAGGIAWMILKRDEEDSGEARMSQAYLEDYRDLFEEDFADEDFDEDFPEQSEPGMAWRARRKAGEALEGTKHAARRAAEKARQVARRAGEAARGAGQSLSGLASDVVEKAGEVTGAAGETASDMTSRARQAAQQRLRQARHRASAAAHRAGEQARSGYARSRERFERGLDEYPLGMSAAALAAGVLVGMVVPRTRAEDRLIGEYSHEMKHQARRVTDEGVRRARLAAEREGLAPHTLADQAKGLAQRARDSAGRLAEAAIGAAKESAQRVAETAREEAREMRDAAEERGLTPEAIKQRAQHVAQKAAEGTGLSGQQQHADEFDEDGSSAPASAFGAFESPGSQRPSGA